MNSIVVALCAFLSVASHGRIDDARGGQTVIVVRPTDLDVNQHVNNAKYVEYLQWARWTWLDARGLSRDRLADLKTVLVVVKIDVDYRSEVRFGETLVASTDVERIGEKSIVLKQTVRKEDGSVAADAVVVLVAVDPSTRKSRVLPDEVRSRVEPANKEPE